MTSPVKYTFDHAFDGGAKSRFELEIEQVRVEAEQSAHASYEQGVADGRAQALGEIEAQTLQVLQQLGMAAQNLFNQQGELEDQLKQDMIHLAYGIASKLSSALIRSKPTAEVQALIEDCLQTVAEQPRLVVRVSEQFSEELAARIEAMKQASNFTGDIILIGDSALGQHDCRVEWPDGGTERIQRSIQKEVESAVQRYVMLDRSEQSSPDFDGAEKASLSE